MVVSIFLCFLGVVLLMWIIWAIMFRNYKNGICISDIPKIKSYDKFTKIAWKYIDDNYALVRYNGEHWAICKRDYNKKWVKYSEKIYYFEPNHDLCQKSLDDGISDLNILRVQLFNNFKRQWLKNYEIDPTKDKRFFYDKFSKQLVYNPKRIKKK